jgi:chemotaxis protein CheY-P-specific phosphatase CheC
MTNDRHQKILEDTILNVFEDMYYMFPEKIHSYEQFSFPLAVFSTNVLFCENQKQFFLYADKRLVAKMAKNFLGEEKDFNLDELNDIFREASNVIVGNFISATNIAPDIRFQIPVITEARIDECDTDCSYDIDLFYIIENDFFRIALKG